MTEARKYNRWLFQRVEAALGQRVLEIGSGTGTMTEYLLDRELVLGLEVIPEYVQALRRRFADHPNVRIEGLDITSTSYDFTALDIDSAVSFNVFEHIPDDVAAMRQVYHALRPGGRLALLVPAHQALYGSFDYLIGHQRRYDKGELAEKLRSAGFDVHSISYSNPLGALGWLVNFRLLGHMQLKAVSAYDRLVPMMAAAERLVRPPFGLSVVAIARKPADRLHQPSVIRDPWGLSVPPEQLVSGSPLDAAGQEVRQVVACEATGFPVLDEPIGIVPTDVSPGNAAARESHRA
jgi:SAM-dependent methyltransferase